MIYALLSLFKNMMLNVFYSIIIFILFLPVIYLNPNHFTYGFEGSDPTFAPVDDPVANLAGAVLLSGGAIGYDAKIDDWITLRSPADCTTSHLARAIILAEMYNRPQWVRSLEFDIALLAGQVMGQHPNWSFGVGQVKLKNASATLNKLIGRIHPNLKKNLKKKYDDVSILRALEDNCFNSLITEEFVKTIIEREKPKSVYELASIYNGSRYGNEAVFDYATIVEFLANHQLSDLPDEGGIIFENAWVDQSPSNAMDRISTTGDDLITTAHLVQIQKTSEDTHPQNERGQKLLGCIIPHLSPWPFNGPEINIFLFVSEEKFQGLYELMSDIELDYFVIERDDMKFIDLHGDFVIDKKVDFMKLLRSEFGSKFHIFGDSGKLFSDRSAQSIFQRYYYSVALNDLLKLFPNGVFYDGPVVGFGGEELNCTQHIPDASEPEILLIYAD